jgi:tetratricopeptide (TPR) repeat protein
MAGKKDKLDPEFEIRFFENILKERPDFVEALIALGDLYTKAGFYAKGLEVDLRLSRLRPDDGTVFYNLACDHSLLNNIDAAFKSLTAAIILGYQEWRFIQQDPDLENLRQDQRFSELLEKMKDKNPGVKFPKK